MAAGKVMTFPFPLLFLSLCAAVATLPLPAGAEESPGDVTREISISLNTHGPSLAVGVSEGNGIAGFEISFRFTPEDFVAIAHPELPGPDDHGFYVAVDAAQLVVSGSTERPLATSGFARLVMVPLEIRKPLRDPVHVDIIGCRISDGSGETIPARAATGLNIHASQVNYRVGESQAMECPEYPQPDTHPLRIMSFNIRYDNPGDGPNAWPHRKDMAASMIRSHGAHSAGLQEAQRHQVDDLAERLPGYAWFGVGRDDGNDAGEFVAIFYRKDRLELLDQNTFWLSETPGLAGSRSWESSCPRTVTWGEFRDRGTEKRFFHFNTHFDNHSEEARRLSAKLLLRKIDEIAGDSPVIVTGDLNCGEADPPYKILTTGDEKPENALADAIKVSIDGHHGPSGTFSAFGKQGTPGHRIDFILVGNGVSVLQHGILAETFDGRFPSDHFPVLAEVSLP